MGRSLRSAVGSIIMIRTPRSRLSRLRRPVVSESWLAFGALAEDPLRPRRETGRRARRACDSSIKRAGLCALRGWLACSSPPLRHPLALPQVAQDHEVQAVGADGAG